MRRSIIGFGILAGASLVGLGGFAHAADVALDKVPKVVLDAAQARFPEAKVKGAAHEKTPEGVEIYEVSMDAKGQNVDMTLSPDGTLTLIEQQLTRKELPKEVAATLDAKYPKSKYRLIESLIEVKDKEEVLSSYEVLLITPQKQIRAVQLGLDGKIMKEEKKSAEDEE